MSEGWGYYATARPAKIADDPPTTVVERKYIDLCGWDPVSCSMVDFKLDADSVSDATVIRRYPCEDAREEYRCVEVTVYPADVKIGRGAVASRRFILAVLSSGVEDLDLRELEDYISNLSAILPFLPSCCCQFSFWRALEN